MGLFEYLSKLIGGEKGEVSHKESRTRGRFEQMEPRRMLDADPIHVGGVFIESDDGHDGTADTFEITFEGGAAGTQLTQIIIDGDQTPALAGQINEILRAGDIFFDTADTGFGADHSQPFGGITKVGTFDVTATVVDGTSKLVLNFTGFDAGEKLIFHIDVDEVVRTDLDGAGTNLNTLDPSTLTAAQLAYFNQNGIDPIASGVEFHGTKFAASFTAPGYKDIDGQGIYINVYSTKAADGTQLNLTEDNAGGQRDRTDGVILTLQQKEIPISIAGTVYHDRNLNQNQDVGTEEGIANVTLKLYKKDAGGNYVDTGHTTTTDANGHYEFGTGLGLTSGTYRVVEVQPVDYKYSTASEPGTVNGNPAGQSVAGDLNVITEITIPLGGQHSINNDFGEAKPAEISGFVYHDRNDNGVKDPGEEGIAGVSITATPITTIDAGQTTVTVTTDANGFYTITGLAPGAYKLNEGVVPPQYFDGKDTAGTVDNTAADYGVAGNDEINNIKLISLSKGTQYNFGEIKYASISGHVSLTDSDGNCLNPGDPGYRAVVGAEVKLYDATGALVATATTDANGNYEFTKLTPGVYRIEEVTPAGLIDGGHHVGTINGTVVGVNAGSDATSPSGNDVIANVSLQAGEDGVNYNFCESEPASLSGLVWHDRNNDGVRQTATEEVIPGVEIKLLDAGGNVIATKTTDANGAYSFTGLAKGVYTVMETTPAGYIDGKDNIGTVGGAVVGNDSVNDQFSQVSLKFGDNGVNYDFGEMKLSQISGFVHAETDGDCIIDPGETLISGATITLKNNDTGQIFTTTTDVNGYYEFTGLVAGNYTITETQPTGYLQGDQHAGTAGGDASVQDVISNINLPSDFNSQNNNFCETEPTPPTDPPPPRIPLTPVIPHTPTQTPPLAPLQPVVTPTVTTITPPAVTPTSSTSFFGGTAPAPGYTWHLSVVDGGNPRAVSTPLQNVAFTDRWSLEDFDQAQFQLTVGDGVREHTFGLPGARAVVGDFNGDGVDEIGIFLEGEWFLDINGNGVFDNEDLWAELGTPDDQPVVGDWDGDGKDDIGVFGPEWVGDDRHIRYESGLPDAENTLEVSDYRQRGRQERNLPPDPDEATYDRRELQLTERGKARADLIDHVFRYGDGRQIAITGDWNGDGIRTIGVFNNGRWDLDTDGDGRLSVLDDIVYFGGAGDIPVVGDFNGDGIDDLGVFHNGEFRLDANGDRMANDGDKIVQMGQAGDQPLAGDFDGDGVDEPAIYRETGPVDRTARRDQ